MQDPLGYRLAACLSESELVKIARTKFIVTVKYRIKRRLNDLIECKFISNNRWQDILCGKAQEV
jgi:hypothetical protein